MAKINLAKIVVVFNEKGGSGKSTSSVNLAGTLGLRGYDVAVVDLDTQRTSAKWLSKEGGRNFKGSLWSAELYGAEVAPALQVQATKHEILVVDCPPSVESAATWAVLMVADLVYITTKLGPADVDAVPAAKNLVRKAWETQGREYPARILPTATRLHMADDKAALHSLSGDKQFPVLSTSLGDRKAFTRAMFLGSTAHSIRHSEDAVRELEALADATLKLLSLPMKHKNA